VEKLQEKVAKSPNDAAAQLELARGLESEQRFDEAIQAYRRYTTLRPNSLQGLNQLAALYEQKAQTDAQAIQAAAGQVQAASPGDAFGPDPTSQLGKALGSTQDPVTGSLSTDAQAAYQQAISAYQTTRQAALDVYKRIAELSPNEAAPQLQLGYAAEQAGDLTTALATYRSFVKRFPDDPSTADVRRQITQLTKDLKSARTAGNPQTG
jgi:cytochrome c-type biogenesis protein CcmH/NrfG